MIGRTFLGGILVLGCLVAIVGCGEFGDPPVVAYMAGVIDDVESDPVHEHIPFLEADEWVETFDPDLSWMGYNLVFYRRRVPMLIDMQGRVVHSWPRVRGIGRMRLDREGNLVVIGMDDMIKQYDWEGHLIWAFDLQGENDMPHHDLITLANGNYLVLGQKTETRTDYLHEVDRDGRVVWEWLVVDHLDAHFPDRDREIPDQSHINSVFEVTDNRWFDGGDERFRPGNLLVSARNLNTIFIIDKISGEIVWTYDQGLDYQHEAQMIPKGVLGEGMIVFFNNGKKNRFAYRRSEVTVIHPVSGERVWNYANDRFFTSIAGSQQVLPNGNLLVTSSQGGRTFEITPDKEIVWLWIPPYVPMRVERLPADHCPQLAALGPMSDEPVSRDDREAWVDLELGQFSLSEEFGVRSVAGKRRKLLRQNQGCRVVLLPSEPVVHAGFGFDESRLKGAPDSARFQLTVRPLPNGKPRVVVDEVISSSGDEIFVEMYRAVQGLGYRRAELCVDVRNEDFSSATLDHPSISIENPRFYSQGRAQLVREWNEGRESLQNQEFEERQLRAIGYVQ